MALATARDHAGLKNPRRLDADARVWLAAKVMGKAGSQARHSQKCRAAKVAPDSAGACMVVLNAHSCADGRDLYVSVGLLLRQ